MKKKLVISLILVGLLALVPIIHAIAGSTFDFGHIAGNPPVGEANWTAWLNKSILAGGMPSEIMTEDSTASDSGVDIGYSQYDGDPEVEWILQVENFSNEVNGDIVSMIFGGLGASSGKLWFFTFTWDQFTNFETDHGTVLLSATSWECPAITNQVVSGSEKTITFNADPNKTYYVYKSTQASGAGNSASNGRYLYLKSTTTDSLGVGSFSDTEQLASWYIVILANSTTGALDGCHSEEVNPTAVTLANFSATAQPSGPAVNLAWQTLNEVEVVCFNLYRADSLQGLRTKIFAYIQAEHPGQLRGDYYSRTDSTVLSGKTYVYWVEIVKSTQKTDLSSPEAVTVGFRMYLPSIFR